MTAFRKRLTEILGTSIVLISCSSGREARLRRDMEDSVCFFGGQAIATADIEAALAPILPIDIPSEASFVVQMNGYRVPCDDENNYRESGDSYYIYAETGVSCGGKLYGHVARVDADGAFEVVETKLLSNDRSKGCPVPGRAPEGLLKEPERVALTPETSPGDWLAESAYFEAAAVAAFEHLATELSAWAAPAPLIAWAKRSAVEEKRHAQICRKLARRYGATVPPVRVRKPSSRSLLRLACENAEEGLIREAFSALLAGRQALYAGDLTVRKAMRSIASDEVKHAEFSIALHEWFETRLSKSELSEVQEARATALRDLQNSGYRDYNREVQERLGLPSRTESHMLCKELFN